MGTNVWKRDYSKGFQTIMKRAAGMTLSRQRRYPDGMGGTVK